MVKNGFVNLTKLILLVKFKFS